jgi:hypothetical protein
VEWRGEWEAAERAKKEAARRATAAALLANTRQALEQENATLKQELEALQASSNQGRSAMASEMATSAAQMATAERMLKEQEEASREKRVEELMQLAARRITQLALTRGWLTWLTLYEQQARQKRLLRAATGRLKAPRLTASFVEWRGEWEAAERAAAQEELLRQAAEQRRTVELEAETLRDELAAALEAVKSGTASVADVERMLKEQEEASREKRVEELMQLAARRITQLALSRGWLTWLTLYEQQARQKRLLRAATGRLKAPRLTASFVEWRGEWEAAERAKKEAARRATAAALLANTRQALEQENATLKQELEALQASSSAGSSAMASEMATHAAEMTRMLKEQEEASREKRVEELMQLAARRITQLALSRGWLTWLTLYEQQARQKRLLRAAAGRLKAPRLTASFVEWRGEWEAAERAAAFLEAKRKQQQLRRTLSEELLASQVCSVLDRSTHTQSVLHCSQA